MEQSFGYISIKEAMEKGAGRVGDKDVFPVFKRIVKREGVLCGEIKGYSDALGNPVVIQDSINLNN
jgi:hypothetical protein